ncbi:MAG: class I SAM-dependent methyltransferase, partial [Oscillibacter sp.]|nr:class I SAM-dependent methyltransferase [Oscillibacter sp.]
FIFDVNSPYKLRRMDGVLYTDETEESYCVWRTFFSERQQVCTYQVDLFRLRRDGAWERDYEEHRERAWTEEELRAALAEAGFTDVKLTGDLKMRSPKEDEDRWIFHCKK